jgi:DNA-binding transcriptional LysR family regulator
MELRHLRYFVAVAEELNFTQAAGKLRLAQPSLTRQIQNLEDELGVRLFDRGGNKVSLTEEGRRFLIDARKVLALSVESVKAVQRLGRGESGQLNLGYLFKFNFDLLPGTLAKFYLMCPEIAVNLFDMSPAEQIRALNAQKIDLGFVGLRPLLANGNMAELEWECVAQHKLVAVLPSDHVLAKKSRIKISDLKPFFFVAMSEETHPGSRDWLGGLCAEARFVPKILQDVSIEAGLMTFVAEGLGVTLAREQIRNLPHPGVVFRPLVTTATVNYWIAWRGGNRSSALAQYIEIVKKQATVSKHRRKGHSPVLWASRKQGIGRPGQTARGYGYATESDGSLASDVMNIQAAGETTDGIC